MDEEVFLEMLKSRGSSPREIFQDMRGIVRKRHRSMKNSFKEILKSDSEKFIVGMSVKEF